VQADVGQGGERLQRGLQAAVDLDAVDVDGGNGQALGQHPLPRPDLEHHVPGRELRVADDRVEQVGVGEEVLPEADHGRRYQPNSSRALASTVRSSSS
jgi:hypothetical protein